MRYPMDARRHAEQIRPNFSLGEFASRAPGRTLGVDAYRFGGQLYANELVIEDSILDVVQELREAAGRAVYINSAYRTSMHNTRVGGVSNSAHLSGHAVDVHVVGETPEAVAQWADAHSLVRGLGRYDTFTHIDTKPGRSRRWDNRSSPTDAVPDDSLLVGRSSAAGAPDRDDRGRDLVAVPVSFVAAAVCSFGLGAYAMRELLRTR